MPEAEHGYPCAVCGEFAYRHHRYEPTKPCEQCGMNLIPATAAGACLECLGWPQGKPLWEQRQELIDRVQSMTPERQRVLFAIAQSPDLEERLREGDEMARQFFAAEQEEL